MSKLLFRIARASMRHRRWVVAVWLVVLAAAGLAAASSSGSTVDDYSVPGTQSQQAQDQLAGMPALANAQTQVVFSSSSSITGAAQQAAVQSTLTSMRASPDVMSVSNPFTSDSVSSNGRAAIANVTFTSSSTEVPVSAVDALSDETGAATGAGLQVSFNGEVYPGWQSSLSETPEIIGALVAAVILLLVLGSALAAGLVLVTALSGVGLVVLGCTVLASLTNVSSAAETVALMLTLACGLDYMLFITQRHQSQLADGLTPEDSIPRAFGTAGGSVVFAAIMVMIALCGLGLTGVPFLAVMGYLGAGAVFVTLLMAVTLLPALLGFAGRRVQRRQRERRAGHAHARAEGSRTVGERWAGFVVRRRLPLALGAIALLGLIAVPAAGLALGLPDGQSEPTSNTSRQAYDTIAEDFGPGVNGPLLIVLDVSAADASKAISTISTALQHEPDVVSVSTLDSTAPTAVLQVIPNSEPDDPATASLVSAIRNLEPGWQQQTGAQVLVGGATAIGIDTSDTISADLPLLLIVIIGLAMILLTTVFRTAVVPLESMVGYLLSTLAALGAEVAVFQWGWAKDLLGVSPASTLSYLPVIVLAIIFGLSNDYEVFVVSRIKEEYLHSGDPRAAVCKGTALSARVVTAAALIMGFVFTAFMVTDDPTVKAIAFTLAVGVLLDAFVVRLLLIPALLALGGRRSWYHPRWFARHVPDPDIEGTRLPEPAREMEPADLERETSR